MSGHAIDALQPQDYDTKLYMAAYEATPIDGLDLFNEAMDDEFRAVGFVPVANVFSAFECSTTVAALLELADRDELPAGVELSFESLADLEALKLPIELRQDQIRKFMWFVNHDVRFAITAQNPGILSVVSRLLGGEPELFQDMALFKPPGIGREKPWHQDHAYFNLPLDTPVVGVWIALDDASIENGCMIFKPGGHLSGPVPHFNRRDWQICDAVIMESGGAVAAPLAAGGCLIFDGLTPHGTPMNRSLKRRRAVQYHFVKKGTQRIEIEERLRLFGPEGRNAVC